MIFFNDITSNIKCYVLQIDGWDEAYFAGPN